MKNRKKMHPQIEKKMTRAGVGNFLEVLGMTWFCLTFWYNAGISIGGDATWIGPFIPELSVMLPVCGVGVALIAAGRLVRKSIKLDTWAMLRALVLLVVVAAVAIFSKTPVQSLVWLPVWALALLGLGCGDTFALRSIGRRLIFVIGILLGFLAVGMFPEKISEPVLVAPLLGVAAAWGLAWFQSSPDREVWLAARLFLGWVAATTGIFGTWWLAALAVVIGHQLFDTKNRWHVSDLFLLIWIVAVGGWQWWHEGMESVTAGWLPGFFQNISALLHGVGPGQWLLAAHGDAAHLLPEVIRMPSAGVPLLLQEWGVLGAVLLTGGVVLQSVKNWRWRLLLIAGVLAVGAVLGSESGVVLLLAFATMRPGEVKRPQRSRRSGAPRKTSAAGAADLPAS